MNLEYVAAIALDEAMNETDADESAFMEDPVVFAQAPAARPAKGRKRKIRAKSVFSDVRDALTGMTTLNFTVKIDTPKYGKTLGLDIPDDSSDVGLTGKEGVDETAQSVEADSNDEVLACVEDAGIEYAEGMRQFDVGGARMRCATPANKCRAKNPLTCRYHGIQVFKADIEGMIKAAFQRAGKQFNSELTVTMNHLEGGEGAAAGIVTLGVRVTVPEEDAELVRQGMRDFGNVPGVELVEGEDPGGQVDNLFDIDFDRLDPNQQARFRRDDLPEADETEAAEENETTAERVNAEQGTVRESGQASGDRERQRPQQQGATQTEASAEGERDFNAEIAALQGQIDAVGQKIATDDQNLQFLNGMVQNAPNDAMRQMAQGMVDQAAAAKTDHEQERQRLDGQMSTLQQEREAAEAAARQAEEQRRREEAERAERDHQRGLMNQMAPQDAEFRLPELTSDQREEWETFVSQGPGGSEQIPGIENTLRRSFGVDVDMSEITAVDLDTLMMSHLEDGDADDATIAAVNRVINKYRRGGMNQGGSNNNGMTDFPTRDEFKRAVDHLREGQFAVTRRELEGVMRDLYNNENVDRDNDEDDVQFAEEVIEALPEGNPVRGAMQRALDRYNDANRQTRGDGGSRSHQNDNGQRTETIAEEVRNDNHESSTNEGFSTGEDAARRLTDALSFVTREANAEAPTRNPNESDLDYGNRVIHYNYTQLDAERILPEVNSIINAVRNGERKESVGQQIADMVAHNYNWENRYGEEVAETMSRILTGEDGSVRVAGSTHRADDGHVEFGDANGIMNITIPGFGTIPGHVSAGGLIGNTSATAGNVDTTVTRQQGDRDTSTEEGRENEPQPIGFSNGRQIYPEGSSGQYVRNGAGGWSELRVNPFTGEVMREEDLDDEEYSALHEASMTPTDTISREEFESSRRRDNHRAERATEVGRGDEGRSSETTSARQQDNGTTVGIVAPSTPIEHAAATVQAREAEVERPAAPVASEYTAAGDGNSAKATAQVTDEMRNPLVAEFERAAAEKSRLFAALRERGVDANDRADGDAMKARRYSSYLGSLSHLIGRNGSRLEGKNAGQILEDAQNWVRDAHGADRTLSDGTVQRGRETTKYKRAKDAARFIGSKLGANVSFDDETGNMSVEWTDRPEAVSVNFDYIQGVNPNGAAGGTGWTASSVQAPQHAAAAEGPSANETARSETQPQNTATAATPAFEARNERAGRLNSALQNVRGERARNLLTRIRDRANNG